jgi:sec-independent protein translocase protein TatB
MFDFDAGKLMVFGIVALAVIPPKDLPRVMRTVGKYVSQMRRMAADFQGQFMEAMKEVELDSVKKEIEEIHQASKLDTSFDPAGLMREHAESAIQDKPAPSVAALSVNDNVTVGDPAPQLETHEPLPIEAQPAQAEKAASNAP